MVRAKELTGIDLQIRRDSPLSPEQQLVSQLKLAIMLGELKPGQTLPSVREMEGLTGLGRNVVWRAYSKLAELGALTIEQRKRAVVSSNADPSRASELVAVYDWLGRDVLDRIRALRVNPQSFVRYLDHRLQESDAIQHDTVFVECCKVFAQAWSAEISQRWGVLVPGYDFNKIREMSFDEQARFKSVLVPLAHHEEVLELFRGPHTQVIPLTFVWDEKIIQELQSLPEGAALVMFFAQSAYSDPWVRELRNVCPKLTIEVVPYESPQQVQNVIASRKYQRVHVSGAVIDDVYSEVKAHPDFIQQPLKLDLRSLEEARIQAAVVL